MNLLSVSVAAQKGRSKSHSPSPMRITNSDEIAKLGANPTVNPRQGILIEMGEDIDNSENTLSEERAKSASPTGPTEPSIIPSLRLALKGLKKSFKEMIPFGRRRTPINPNTKIGNSNVPSNNNIPDPKCISHRSASKARFTRRKGGTGSRDTLFYFPSSAAAQMTQTSDCIRNSWVNESMLYRSPVPYNYASPYVSPYTLDTQRRPPPIFPMGHKFGGTEKGSMVPPSVAPSSPRHRALILASREQDVEDTETHLHIQQKSKLAGVALSPRGVRNASQRQRLRHPARVIARTNAAQRGRFAKPNYVNERGYVKTFPYKKPKRVQSWMSPTSPDHQDGNETLEDLAQDVLARRTPKPNSSCYTAEHQNPTRAVTLRRTPKPNSSCYTSDRIVAQRTSNPRQTNPISSTSPIQPSPMARTLSHTQTPLRADTNITSTVVSDAFINQRLAPPAAGSRCNSKKKGGRQSKKSADEHPKKMTDSLRSSNATSVMMNSFVASPNSSSVKHRVASPSGINLTLVKTSSGRVPQFGACKKKHKFESMELAQTEEVLL